MNNIKLRAVSDADAGFLFRIMNTDAILEALNEVPTQPEDWVDAIQAWSRDDDEEDYIICDGNLPIGWLGINGLSSVDKVVYLKLAAILPAYHNKGVGHYAISRIVGMLRQRNYSKILLYTDQNNLKAKACYGKCGFKVAETLTERMANGREVARCIMELIL